MITCLKCKQKYSEQDHECLEVMDLEEVMSPVDTLQEKLNKLLAPIIGKPINVETLDEYKEKTIAFLQQHQIDNGHPMFDVASLVESVFGELFPPKPDVLFSCCFSFKPNFELLQGAELDRAAFEHYGLFRHSVPIEPDEHLKDRIRSIEESRPSRSEE